MTLQVATADLHSTPLLRGLSPAELEDGLSNTLMMVEVKDSNYHWAEPRDLDFSQPNVTLSSRHPGITNAAFADGSVRPIANSTPPQIIHAAATRAGSEPPQLQ